MPRAKTSLQSLDRESSCPSAIYQNNSGHPIPSREDSSSNNQSLRRLLAPCRLGQSSHSSLFEAIDYPEFCAKSSECRPLMLSARLCPARVSRGIADTVLP